MSKKENYHFQKCYRGNFHLLTCKIALQTTRIHFFISSIAVTASSSVIRMSQTPLPSFRARDKAREPADLTKPAISAPLKPSVSAAKS
mmetsp:Transcript_14943/g.34669  ORF Transcript_14943/g.34669 Transcript_14943/m.34669 type:complete len:88 (+) Transcript_14943:239-502(+)